MTIRQGCDLNEFAAGFLEIEILDPSCIISFRYAELKGVWHEFVYS